MAWMDLSTSQDQQAKIRNGYTRAAARRLALCLIVH